jgi:hypothetical protein
MLIFQQDAINVVAWNLIQILRIQIINFQKVVFHVINDGNIMKYYMKQNMKEKQQVNL